MKTKLLSAILTALLAMSPVLAAMDLGDYPSFLFADNNLDAYVVVGAAAKPADVVGAVDLATRLAGESYEAVDNSGTTVSGGKSEDVNLGFNISTDHKTSLDDDDLAGFQDTTITFDSSTYNVHDALTLGTASPSIEVSRSENGEDKYESNVYMEAARGSIGYYYLFDDTINLSKVDADTNLVFEFLGRTLTMVAVADENTFTLRVGDEYYLSVGDSVVVNDKTVTLNNVGSSSVSIDVDGDTKIINSGTEKTVNGVKIKVDSVFSSDVMAERAAFLIMGENAEKQYDDADAYIGQDENDPDWKWDLGELITTTVKGDTADGSGGPTIGIVNDFVYDDYADNPPGVGECLSLPNKYASICYDSLTVDSDSYETVQVSFSTSIDVDEADAQGQIWGSSEDGVMIEVTSGSDSIVLDEDAAGWTSEYMSGDASTRTVYLVAAGLTNVINVFYLDEDNDPVFAGNITPAGAQGTPVNWGFIDYKDTTGTTDIELAFDGNKVANTLRLVAQEEHQDLAHNNDIYMWLYNNSAGTLVQLGDTADTKEADELVYGTGTNANIGTKDEDHRTYYGIIIEDPESNGDSDQVVLKIPGDVVEAKIVIKGPGTTTISGDTVKSVVPITNAVAKLDTEVSLPVGKHLVLVGGPGVNKLTATALGLTYPTYGSSGLLPFAEGEGYIAVTDGVVEVGKYAVVVAGWEAEDTRDACSVLQQFGSFATQLDGNMAVKVTSVSASGITPVSE
jgi:hypothetical protein